MNRVKRVGLLAGGLLGLLLPLSASAQGTPPAAVEPGPPPVQVAPMVPMAPGPPPVPVVPMAPVASDPCPGDPEKRHCPAQVVLVRRGWVVIEADRQISEGERFLIISQRPVRGLDPVTGQEGVVPESERTGMLVIERTNGQQAAGRLVRNAYAQVGDLAVPTTERYAESYAYGRRFPSTWRLASDLWTGPLFGSPVTGGLLATVSLEYRFAIPLKLAVELGPAFLAGPSSYNRPYATFQGSVRGVVGLALSAFELSVGLGVQGDTSLGAAPQLSLAMRLGSLDGLNLTAHSTFLLPGTGRTYLFDSAYGSFNIPVHRRLTLGLTAGGGGNGALAWAMSTIDFRAYITGTGGPGTWILNLGIGGYGASRQNQSCYPTQTGPQSCYPQVDSLGGPAFHLGFDTRF